MIKRVYKAQKAQPSPGDFVNLVNEDCESIGLDMTESEMTNISKDKLKKIVKAKVINAAFIYLQSLKQNHSKMDNLKYNKFEPAAYLSSPVFNSVSRSLLLALRTRTVRGIRSDFGGLYPNKMCPLGCGEKDTLQNILTCKVLKQYHVSNDVTNNVIQYTDIFSSDIGKQKKVTHLYEQLLEIRNKMMSSLPVASTGPVQSVEALQELSVLSV